LFDKNPVLSDEMLDWYSVLQLGVKTTDYFEEINIIRRFHNL